MNEPIVSEELRQRLRMLEEDYATQPVVVQQEDLPEINRIRAELKMPLVDSALKEIISADAPAVPIASATTPTARDHSEARAIYQAYLKKAEVLEAHRAYAMRVAQATAGSGMTRVSPLATMGTNGGALLCDQCRKPIVLEGGPYHGVNADTAWQRHPNPTKDWTSWILGGLVVEILVNGTLRIYHGYPGRNDNQCCNVAGAREKAAREDFKKAKREVVNRKVFIDFLVDEFPTMASNDRYTLVSKIVDVMYGYDPGFGVNRPSPT